MRKKFKIGGVEMLVLVYSVKNIFSKQKINQQTCKFEKRWCNSSRPQIVNVNPPARGDYRILEIVTK